MQSTQHAIHCYNFSMTEPQLSAWAEIDLAAIAHNVRLLRQAVKPPTRLMAVVKANAYGHGAAPVARTALAHGAEWLGVARVSEGIELREAQIGVPILVLGAIAPAEVAEAVRARLTVAVASPHIARELSDQSQQQNLVTPVHLKVDTGMTRFGVPPEEVADFARALLALPALRLEGAFTHFATADEPADTFSQQQLRRFQQALADLERLHIPIDIRHAANSAGTLLSNEFHLDMVRVGLAVYGIAPASHLPFCDQLRPALSLKSRVVAVRSVPPGTSIGYGRTFICEQATRMALVSIGYADGVRRALSNKGEVLIRGQRARMLGRVSMDQLVVCVDELEASEGDEVTLIGRQGDARISIEEVARWADTIPYEILTGIAARVPRVYVNSEQ